MKKQIIAQKKAAQSLFKQLAAFPVLFTNKLQIRFITIFISKIHQTKFKFYQRIVTHCELSW